MNEREIRESLQRNNWNPERTINALFNQQAAAP